MGMSAGAEGLPDPKSKRSLYGVFFGRFTQFAALPVMFLSFILPVDGAGVTICWIKRWCNLPCPGCGLTRSITCLSQLEFQKAWQYHPFGFLIYGLFVLNVLLMFQREKAKQHIQCWFLQNDCVIRPTYWTLVTLFLVFGGVRFLTA